MKFTCTNENNSFRITKEGINKADCMQKIYSALCQINDVFTDVVMLKKEDNDWEIYKLSLYKGIPVEVKRLSNRAVKKAAVTISHVTPTEKFNPENFDWQYKDITLEIVSHDDMQTTFSLHNDCPFLQIKIPTYLLATYAEEKKFELDFGYSLEF